MRLLHRYIFTPHFAGQESTPCTLQPHVRHSNSNGGRVLRNHFWFIISNSTHTCALTFPLFFTLTNNIRLPTRRMTLRCHYIDNLSNFYSCKYIYGEEGICGGLLYVSLPIHFLPSTFLWCDEISLHEAAFVCILYVCVFSEGICDLSYNLAVCTCKCLGPNSIMVL